MIRMRIGIDLSPVEKDPAGIGQYTLSLFTELCKIDKQNTYVTFTTAPFLFANAENRVVKVSKDIPARGLRWIYAVSNDARRNNIDIIISPSNHIFTQFFPRTIQFIHDLAPIFYPQFFKRFAAIKYRSTCKIACKKAIKVLTISQTVLDEITDRYPTSRGKIDYIYPGLNKWVELAAQSKSEVMGRYYLDSDYIMTLSTLEPRKNHLHMLEAFKIFKSRTLSPLKFVIIGKKGWFFEDIFKKVKELELENEVIFLGYIPNKEISNLISHAKAFVFMSYYEGFGIPPLEALSLNIPTIVSDIPVFKEIYQDKAIYTDPFSPDKIALAIQEALTKRAIKTDKFVKENFSWENSAKKLLKIINGTK